MEDLGAGLSAAGLTVGKTGSGRETSPEDLTFSSLIVGLRDCAAKKL